MKKIIFMMALLGLLTSCGDKNVTEEKLITEPIQEEEIIGTVSNGDNIIIEEKIENEEINIIDNIEAKESEVEEKIEKLDKEDNVKIVECAEDQEVSSESTVHEEIVYEKGVEVGKKAVDFEVELLSGEMVKLSDYVGKPVFLNFWATWCGPCVGEMPDIEKINKEYGDRLVVLAINGGELKSDVQTFINRKGYTFRIGLDQIGNILNTYDSMYIPLSVFIDENGLIKERVVGALSESRMKEIVDKLVEDK